MLKITSGVFVTLGVDNAVGLSFCFVAVKIAFTLFGDDMVDYPLLF